MFEPFSRTGVGIHTAASCAVRIEAASPGHGLIFETTRGPVPARPAAIDPDAARATDLIFGGARIRTVEHLLAALAWCGVTDATIAVDGPEIPERLRVRARRLVEVEGVTVSPETVAELRGSLPRRVGVVGQDPSGAVAVAQQLHDARDARGTRGSKTGNRQPADADAIGARSDAFHDVAAAHEAARFLRFGDRSGDRPARADPG